MKTIKTLRNSENVGPKKKKKGDEVVLMFLNKKKKKWGFSVHPTPPNKKIKLGLKKQKNKTRM